MNIQVDKRIVAPDEYPVEPVTGSNEALKPCPTCNDTRKVLGQSNWENCGPMDFDQIEPCPDCSTDTPVCASTEEVVKRVADFLNAFKADPFSTGADKAERLLEIVREASSIPEPLIMPSRTALVAYELWRLLDDIDTADDVTKSDDAMFRRYARRYQRQRFDFMSGEEWDALHAIAMEARRGEDIAQGPSHEQ